MGRRGENIRYRKWDRRWEARVVCAPPVNGKTQYKYIYGKSYKEVRLKKQALEKLLKAGYSAIPDIAADTVPFADCTFSYAAEAWLASKKSILKESSFATYSYLTDHYLLPVLGNMQLESVNRKVLEDLFAQMRADDFKTLSDKTMCDIRTILSQILSYAVSHGMIANAPECPSVPTRKPTARALETREREELEQAALQEDTPFSTSLIVLNYTGLRDGEICGLKWGDIDLEEGTLHVERTVSRIRDIEAGPDDPKTKVVIGSPKTDCSRRIVPLPEDIIRYLEGRRLSDDIYLATGTAKCMEPRAFLAKFNRFQNRNNLKACTVHTLRHSYATQCIASGVDVKSLSEIMGHANVKITMQLYVHPSIESKKAEVNKLPCKFISGLNNGQHIAKTIDS